MTHLSRARLRGSAPGALALAMILVLYFVAQLPSASAAQKNALASAYKFTGMPIAMPPGYDSVPKQTIRQVNPEYEHIAAWVSSIGAGVAINDFTGRGRSDGMCVVDTRTNSVIVTYTPDAPAVDRFTPFVLDPGPAYYAPKTMAPMGCTPGDFNGDGRMDLLVDYWGRPPMLFLARSTATTLSPSAYKPQELFPTTMVNGVYEGPKWNSAAVAVADLAGTGHPDLFIGNYYPDSDVLDVNGLKNVAMNSSMSNAKNAGGDHVFRWVGGRGGTDPSVTYQEQPNAIPYKASTGWTLAAATADLTGSGLPDLYIANDFGKDHLLHNVTKPGGPIRFKEATGSRGATTPKSFAVGHGSFKGMGANFADVNDNGRFDFFTGNITTAWGLQESNFLFMNNARNNAEMAAALNKGEAPFTQEAEQKGMAWTGWSWGAKFADFANSGHDALVQTDGFVKGDIDRWNWLQEMAAANDDVYTNPTTWPDVKKGDDIAGRQQLAFWAPSSNGRFVNISKRLGLADPVPTRDVAIADATGDGALDFAVARQWAAPAYYANSSRNLGDYLDLNLYRPVSEGTAGHDLQGPGTPAYGATVQITIPGPGGHTQISQLDGGSGTTGRSSFQVPFGLGSYDGPVTVNIRWNDAGGRVHEQTLRLTPGTHTLCLLQTTAEQVSACPVIPTA